MEKGGTQGKKSRIGLVLAKYPKLSSPSTLKKNHKLLASLIQAQRIPGLPVSRHNTRLVKLRSGRINRNSTVEVAKNLSPHLIFVPDIVIWLHESLVSS